MSEAIKHFIANIPTAYLVEELSRREGVVAARIDPYDKKFCTVDGPAVVLIVKD